ncbi:MAG: FHA domain-containing protein [Pseudomonadota bacterium]
MAGRSGRGERGHWGSILGGSLKDALTAASRTDGRGANEPAKIAPPADVMADTVNFDGLKDVTEAARELDRAAADAASLQATAPDAGDEDGADAPPPIPAGANEAAREARGGRPNVPPVQASAPDNEPPTTRVVRDAAVTMDDDVAKTELVRGKRKVERGAFKQDPVVGWLVVVGGPGLGSYRPVFEGNNTVGRADTNRVPIDFGDEAISNEEQVYIRYDSADRSFLLVPNLAKTNVVSVNEKRPTQAVSLVAMDVITMGRTQLVFVPFCGADFDWGDLNELSR